MLVLSLENLAEEVRFTADLQKITLKMKFNDKGQGARKRRRGVLSLKWFHSILFGVNEEVTFLSIHQQK